MRGWQRWQRFLPHSYWLMTSATLLLVMVYHMLRCRRPYQDLGRNYRDEREPEASVWQSVRRLEHLGLQITLQTAEEVA